MLIYQKLIIYNNYSFSNKMYLRYNTDLSTQVCFNYNERIILEIFICISLSLFCYSMYNIVNQYNQTKIIEENIHKTYLRKINKYTYDNEYKYIYSYKQNLPRIIQKKIERKIPSSKPVSISIE